MSVEGKQYIGLESDDDDEPESRDWHKVDENAKNSGYRAGLEASQDDVLQKGFNTGFQEALQMAVAGGRLQGEICARLTNPFAAKSTDDNGKDSNTHQSTTLQNLLTESSELVAGIPDFVNPSQQCDCAGGDKVVNSITEEMGESESGKLCGQNKTCNSEEVDGSLTSALASASIGDSNRTSSSPFWNKLESLRAQVSSVSDTPTSFSE